MYCGSFYIVFITHLLEETLGQVVNKDHVILIWIKLEDIQKGILEISPDGFWFENDHNRYALVSGDTDRGSRCGGSPLALHDTSGHRVWRVGAGM